RVCAPLSRRPSGRRINQRHPYRSIGFRNRRLVWAVITFAQYPSERSPSYRTDWGCRWKASRTPYGTPAISRHPTDFTRLPRYSFGHSRHSYFARKNRIYLLWNLVAGWHAHSDADYVANGNGRRLHQSGSSWRRFLL